jgi:hypothetical protein
VLGLADRFGRLLRWRPAFRWIRAISYFSIIPAVLFFVFEQRAARHAAQVEAAHALMIQSNSDELVSLSMRLSKPWLEDDYVKFREARPSFAASEAMKELKFQQHNIDLSDIMRMANFYQIVLLCKDSGRCDAQTIDTYFCQEIRQFTSFFRPQMEAIRTRLGRSDTYQFLIEHAENCSET